jgi:hypothetical protein
MMRRLVSAVMIATFLPACGLAANVSTSPSPTSSPTSSPATPEAGFLLARPLKLPVVRAGETCPVTPAASRKLGIGDPRGTGPFYLGGPMPQGAYAWNKMVWVLVDGASGPVLFRGGRVDGAGSLQFNGSPADRSDKGLTLSSNGGVSATFCQRVISQGVADAFYVYPAVTGCYALQVDGPSFDDVIVISTT